MRPRSRGAAALGVSLLLLAGACGDDDGGDGGGGSEGATVELPPGYEGYQSELYGDDANWLCKPGKDEDVCSRDLDTTVVNADGTTEVQAHERAEDPPIDCFYVYPTTSTDGTPNSDLEVAEEQEIHTTYIQAARFTATCRVFAPVYRQLTVPQIFADQASEGAPGTSPVWQSAYEDVLDAFRHFVANESDGRPFVLVGHSQGSEHLRHLIADEIDNQPVLRDRLVSALLLGWPVVVPEDNVVGGAFQNVPLCQATAQTGCVVNYSSYRSTDPPDPATARFGRPFEGEGRVGCVNPASPGGGAASLHPYFLVEQPMGALLGAPSQPFTDPALATEVTTPFVTYPDLITGECVTEGDINYLRLTVNADTMDPRTDEIGGDFPAGEGWGTHIIDVSVAMGDLVELVRAQAEAFVGPGFAG
jgi:hypothetical protein